MPFEPGNELEKLRKVRRGGPRTQAEIKREELEQKAFIAAALKDGKAKGEHYSRRVFENDQVLLDYRRWLTDDGEESQHRPISINFVQYNNTVQLSAEGVSTAVLASNGEQKASGAGVASQSGQRQDRIEFHDFEDVS